MICSITKEYILLYYFMLQYWYVFNNKMQEHIMFLRYNKWGAYLRRNEVYMNENEQLLKFIKNGTSPFHVVETTCDILDNTGFTRLDLSSNWDLVLGKNYYTTIYDTSVFAFTLGHILDDTPVLRIAAAHTDQPCLRIKPDPQSITKNYIKINTEVYGGAILSTWFDRPLSVAGRITLASDDIFAPTTTLVDFKHAIMTIPSLAIHLSKNNNLADISKQNHLAPIVGFINDELNKDSYFMTHLAQELGVSIKDILDFDLYIYNYEEGSPIGLDDEFISSPRLDNLTSVTALIEGLTTGTRADSINMICLYDNEEVGSHTKQGADSSIANIILSKIYSSLGMDSSILFDSITKGFMISADVAHGYHPNYTDKYDSNTYCELNKGVAIKVNSSQRYATDSVAIGSIMQLCDAYNVPFQKFVNHSDIVGGSTLGSLSSSWLPIKTVDLGVPILAMHSAREFMGGEDQKSLNRLMTAFFSA